MPSSFRLLLALVLAASLAGCGGCDDNSVLPTDDASDSMDGDILEDVAEDVEEETDGDAEDGDANDTDDDAEDGSGDDAEDGSGDEPAPERRSVTPGSAGGELRGERYRASIRFGGPPSVEAAGQDYEFQAGPGVPHPADNP